MPPFTDSLLFDTLLEAVPDAIIIVDPEGTIVQLNAQAGQLFGYDPQALIGKAIEVLLPTRYHATHRPFRQRFFKDPKIRRMGSGVTLYGLRKDGSEFPVEISLSPLRDQGRLFAVSAIRDVSHRVRVTQALHEREEQFRSLVRNIPGTTYRCLHDEAWTMKFISADVEILTGFSPTDFIDNAVRTFDSVIFPDDRKYVAQQVDDAIEAVQPWSIEYRIVRQDGSVRWVAERGQAVLSDEGRIHYLDGAIFDITDRKQIEVELLENQARLDLTLSSSGVGTWDWDILAGTNTWDDASHRIAGLKPGTFGGDYESFRKLIHPEDLEQVEMEVQWAVDGERDYNAEYRLVRPDGDVRYVAARGKVLKDVAGQAVRMLGTWWDITDRIEVKTELLKARDAAQAANRAKSEFLSNMSHELRTPLNGVLGYAQILQRDPNATGRQRDNLDAIISCGEHLLTLINDVLDLSKIEADRIEIDPQPCDFRKLVKGVSDIVAQRAKAKDITFSLQVSPEVPQGIVIDATKLRQILINLLGNAVKFTHEGGVTLRVAETGDQQLRIDVIDTGIGIPADELQDIFDPFKQAQAGKAAGGTGLGLAISRRLTKMMGGELDVESTVGQGSRFGITLPLVEIEDEDFSPVEDHDALSHQPLPSLAPGQDVTILVADDRDTNRDILAQLLEGCGFSVVLANDGQEALEKLQTQPIPLVLMDVRMPRMNGIEATQHIRQDEALKETVVIAVTASVFPEFKDYALQAGFDDFLGKPLRAHELLQKIEAHLDVVYETLTAEEVEVSSMKKESKALPSARATDIGNRLRDAVKIRSLTAINALAAELASDEETDGIGKRIAESAAAFDFQSLGQLAEELEAQSE